jgi:hypothetical protein
LVLSASSVWFRLPTQLTNSVEQVPAWEYYTRSS